MRLIAVACIALMLLSGCVSPQEAQKQTDLDAANQEAARCDSGGAASKACQDAAMNYAFAGDIYKAKRYFLTACEKAAFDASDLFIHWYPNESFSYDMSTCEVFDPARLTPIQSGSSYALVLPSVSDLDRQNLPFIAKQVIADFDQSRGRSDYDRLWYRNSLLKFYDKLPPDQKDKKTAAFIHRMLCEKGAFQSYCTIAIAEGQTIDFNLVSESQQKVRAAIADTLQNFADTTAKIQAQEAARQAQQQAGLQAFLGAVSGMSQGGNPQLVNLNAQTYLAQSQAQIQSDLASGNTPTRADEADIGALGRQFAGMQNNAPSATGQLMASPEQGSGTMSLAEQHIEAKRLQSLCGNDPRVTHLEDQARKGSMRASYEGAAALMQCYYDNVDSRYPADQKQQWADAIAKNKQQAAALQ